MKKYIILNKNNKNQLGGKTLKKIIILSWNVSWEAMTTNNSGQFKLCGKNPNKTCNNNIILNISNTIKKFNPDILGFQEASKYNDIINILNTSLYNYFVNSSGLEDMLTCWSTKTFTLINSFSYEFEKGRPFAIIILKQNYNNNIIYLINIHSAHNSNTQSSIFDIINQFIKNNINDELKKNINRVIILGDYNRNTFNDNTSNYKIIIGNIHFILKRSNYKGNTCCSLKGYLTNKNYDYILDSTNLVERLLINTEPYYKIPSSDHIMIIGIIK